VAPETSLMNTRGATRYILIALSFTAVAVLLWRTSEVAIAAFGGIVGAAGWRGIAAPLARRSGWPIRRWVMIVVLAFVVAVAALGWVFGAQAGEQFGQLQQTLPRAFERVRDAIDASPMGHQILGQLQDGGNGQKLLAQLGLATVSIVRGATDCILIFFVSIYFALDPREYLEGFLRLLPPARRARVRHALLDAGDALQKWLLAQLLAMATVGVAVTVGLALLHVPLAVLLGAIAALLEFIPVLGPVLFAIPGILVATTQDTRTVLLVTGLYVVVQTLESNVLVPLLQRWAVRLPPVISLLAALVGAVLFGPVGLLFASPLAVVAMKLVKHLYVEDALEQPSPR
jgi:predicted PurR-regulated permease PerM